MKKIIFLSILLLFNVSCVQKVCYRPQCMEKPSEAGSLEVNWASTPMRNFKVALIQHSSPLDRKSENLATTIRFSRQAQAAGAELVCFPELNITGHAGHADMIKQAEAVPAGESVQKLIDLAKELGIYIAAGIAEDDKGIHYNTFFIVGPEGFVGKQRKVHLSSDEYFYFRGGTDISLLQLPFARVGIVICYDSQVPEVARCLGVKGAEVLLVPHAARSGKWPSDDGKRKEKVASIIARGKKSWSMVGSCRAYDNGCYYLFCNTAGQSAEYLAGVEANHAGGILAFSPYGSLIAESKSTDAVEEMVLVDIDAAKVKQRRQRACFNLQTRKSHAFGVLCEPTK